MPWATANQAVFVSDTICARMSRAMVGNMRSPDTDRGTLVTARPRMEIVCLAKSKTWLPITTRLADELVRRARGAIRAMNSEPPRSRRLKFPANQSRPLLCIPDAPARVGTEADRLGYRRTRKFKVRPPDRDAFRRLFGRDGLGSNGLVPSWAVTEAGAHASTSMIKGERA